MNINATLLVQVVNFWLVYWMLRTFLFRPTVAVIDHEAAERATLLTIVDQQKKSVDIQEKERERYAFMWREYFCLHRPEVMRSCINVEAMIQGEERETASLEKEYRVVAENISKALEEKIKNVH